MPNKTQIEKAKKTTDILMEINHLLGADLDEQLLSICLGLIETGMNPEVLASLVRTLQTAGAQMKDDDSNTS